MKKKNQKEFIKYAQITISSANLFVTLQTLLNKNVELTQEEKEQTKDFTKLDNFYNIDEQNNTRELKNGYTIELAKKWLLYNNKNILQLRDSKLDKKFKNEFVKLIEKVARYNFDFKTRTPKKEIEKVYIKQEDFKLFCEYVKNIYQLNNVKDIDKKLDFNFAKRVVYSAMNLKMKR